MPKGQDFDETILFYNKMVSDLDPDDCISMPVHDVKKILGNIRRLENSVAKQEKIADRAFEQNETLATENETLAEAYERAHDLEQVLERIVRVNNGEDVYG